MSDTEPNDILSFDCRNDNVPSVQKQRSEINNDLDSWPYEPVDSHRVQFTTSDYEDDEQVISISNRSGCLNGASDMEFFLAVFI